MASIRPLLLAACLAGTSLAALAHDSWLAPQPDGVWLLGTGDQFPVLETPIGTEYLPRQGCVDAAGQPLPRPTALPYTATALPLRPPAGAASCWMQTSAFDVELTPRTIPAYLKEVRPGAEMLATWQAMAARGLPWRERYVKHLRIERPGSGPAAVPSGLGMDMLLQGERRTLQAGDRVTVQVLRDGQPVPGLSVEWRHERGRIGLWQRTDAQGLVTQPLPLAGHWLLRAIDLRLSTEQPDQFDSRFMTLALEVAPAPR
ncbi:DUF4198 domain-containing protein [Ideonella sp. DXS22W]|uniref:DUF4198 domain-containing protein n=1 Tax=Pseudaquabacterium inlustre TaxID=2984192 RepID=A0ABU9CM45_9BURK